MHSDQAESLYHHDYGHFTIGLPDLAHLQFSVSDLANLIKRSKVSASLYSLFTLVTIFYQSAVSNKFKKYKQPAQTEK